MTPRSSNAPSCSQSVSSVSIERCRASLKPSSSGSNYCARAPRWAQTTGQPVDPRTRAEFLAKLGLVLEEVFWLELMLETGVFPAARLTALLKEANELTSIFVASLRTAKGLFPAA
jgi:hypothetical protein